MHKTILLTGCHQPYGRALARVLANIPNVQLWVVGEHAGDCASLCDDIRADVPDCHIHPLDTPNDTPAQMIAASGAKLVVHAAAPFSRHDYSMALASIEAGASYVDVAERRSFIASFTGALHPLAKRAGVCAITGASMTPAMTSAILEDMAPAFHHLEDVRVTIVPGIRSLQSGSQMAAMLATIGRPMDMLSQGERVRAMSGRGLRSIRLPSLGRCTSVLCDLPDNETLPPLHPHLRTLETRMALPGRLAPRAVWLLSYMRQRERSHKHQRTGTVSSHKHGRTQEMLKKSPHMVPWLVKRLTKAPPHHGAVLVEATGSDAYGRPLHRNCRIEATPAEAPYFPILPAVALVRQMITHPNAIPAGAVPCLGIISLKEILAEMYALHGLIERREQRLALPSPSDSPSKAAVPKIGSSVNPAPI